MFHVMVLCIYEIFNPVDEICLKNIFKIRISPKLYIKHNYKLERMYEYNVFRSLRIISFSATEKLLSWIIHINCLDN